MLALLSSVVAPRKAQHRQAVYIEDTDTFGVTFYANYVRFYERAACSLLGYDVCARAMKEEGLFVSVDSLKGMRYSSPALLGDDIFVQIEQTGQDESGRLGFSANVIRAQDGTVLNSVSDMRLAFRKISDGTIHPPPGQEEQEASLESRESSDMDVPATISAPHELILQADELGGHGALTIHTALRYFERQRTSLIGGPDALKRLQDDGTQVVVGYAPSRYLVYQF